MGTDENLFRLVRLPGYGERVLPPDLVPVPGHGAQICAWVPTKGYVQTKWSLNQPKNTVRALLSPRGTYLILDPKRGGLIKEGGLTERGGGLFLIIYFFFTKFTVFQTLLLQQ